MVITGEVIDDGIGIGTIRNMDSQPPEWLSRFGRTVAEQNVDAIRNRFTVERTPGFFGQFVGQEIRRTNISDNHLTDQIEQNKELSGDSQVEPTSLPVRNVGSVPEFRDSFDPSESREITDEEILLGTSFNVTKLNNNGLSFGVWGRTAKSGYSGGEGEQSVEGDVTSLMFGADWKRNDTLFGLMVSRSSGKGIYGSSVRGKIKAKLTSFVPYVSHQFNNDLSVWGAVGIGHGKMELSSHFGDNISTDMDWRMVAAGAEGTLVPEEINNGIGLNWYTDALWVSTGTDEVPGGLSASSKENTRFRLGLNASWDHMLDSGVSLRPNLEVGIRYDGGDAETGYGLEVGAGVEWTNSETGLSVSVEGRTLALHEDGNFEDWGLGLGIQYDPNPKTKEGFSAQFGYGLGGNSSGGQQALNGPDTFPGLEETESEGTWSLETAYGITRGGGMVGSPYAAISGGSSESISKSTLGYRIEPDTEHATNINIDFWTNPNAKLEETSTGVGLTWQW